MEKIIKLYRSLKNIEPDFNRLYNVYGKNHNIINFDSQFTKQCEYIFSLIMEINALKCQYKKKFLYSVDNFCVLGGCNWYHDGEHLITIEFPSFDSMYNINNVSINNIFICHNNSHVKSIELYVRKQQYPYDISYIKDKLYCNENKINLLILIISTQHTFNYKNRLPHEIYDYIFYEFIR